MEVAQLYDSFGEEKLDPQKVAAIRLKMEQIYQYEKGKGPKNAETARQIQIIHENH